MCNYGWIVLPYLLDASFVTSASTFRVTDLALLLNQSGTVLSQRYFHRVAQWDVPLADVTFDSVLGLNVGPRHRSSSFRVLALLDRHQPLSVRPGRSSGGLEHDEQQLWRRTSHRPHYGLRFFLTMDLAVGRRSRWSPAAWRRNLRPRQC